MKRLLGVSVSLAMLCAVAYGQSDPDGDGFAEYPAYSGGLGLQDGSSLDGWEVMFGNMSLYQGRLRVTGSGGDYTGRMLISFPTEAGKDYIITGKGIAGTAGARVAISNTPSLEGAILDVPAQAAGFYVPFTATADKTYLFLRLAEVGKKGEYADFDDIQVKAAELRYEPKK